MRARQYLYIYESLLIEIPEAELGSGKTLDAKFSTLSKGKPSTAIGSLSATATAAAAKYSIVFARAAFMTDLGDKIGQAVNLHLDDGAAWHEVYPFLVTDVDPKLLPELT